jgi:hypothetical protein
MTLQFGMDSFDHAAFREAVSGPGIDTRNFISYGIVEPDSSSSQHAVAFNDSDGNPLPEGILIQVKLQPSGVIVTCRVSMHSGGSGEAEYTPYGPGDEVLVAIPDGDERGGCAIIGRFANTFDSFPQTVSGMDVTQNNVAFKRVRVPYLLETSASYSVRQSLTGASMAINPTGDLLFTSGDGHTLAMNATVLSIEDASGLTQFQIDPNKEQVLMFANTTQFVLDDQNTSLNTSGTVSFGTAGNGPFEHVTTIEAVANILVAFGALITTGPLTPLQVAAAIATAATTPTLPTTSAAILAGFQTPKSALLPGIGCPGFLVG